MTTTQADLERMLEPIKCVVCKKGGAGHSVFVTANGEEKHRGHVHMRMTKGEKKEIEPGCCAATILKTKPEGAAVDFRPVGALRDYLAQKKKEKSAADFWGDTLGAKLKEAIATKAATEPPPEADKNPVPPLAKKGFFG